MKALYTIEKSYNTQLAVAHIIYMMAGSYFDHSCLCRNYKNFYLHYAEMPRQKQYQYEERVIRVMEKMGGDFLRRLGSLHCEVSSRFCGEDLQMEFRTGGFEGLCCTVHKDGTFWIEQVEAA